MGTGPNNNFGVLRRVILRGDHIPSWPARNMNTRAYTSNVTTRKGRGDLRARVYIYYYYCTRLDRQWIDRSPGAGTRNKRPRNRKYRSRVVLNSDRNRLSRSSVCGAGGGERVVTRTGCIYIFIIVRFVGRRNSLIVVVHVVWCDATTTATSLVVFGPAATILSPTNVRLTWSPPHVPETRRAPPINGRCGSFNRPTLLNRQPTTT